MQFLVACHEIEPCSGGLLRFARVGRILARHGHRLCFAVSPNATGQPPSFQGFSVMSAGDAESLAWDAVMVPGAAFPEETIRGFSLLSKSNFGVRVQHVLNGPQLLLAFEAVNYCLQPDVVLFNNAHWPLSLRKKLPAARSAVLIGAVDTGRFHPRREESSEAARDRWVIGGLANKNPRPLVEALAYLPPHFGVRLFGIDSEGLAKRYHDLVEAGRLELCGIIDEANLPDLYHGFNCVVMTEQYAGWSNLVAEAMASGIPVICTTKGTLALARNIETALILDEPNAEAIARKVRMLSDDHILAERMTDAARLGVQAYSWEQYTERLLNFIFNDARRVGCSS